MNTKDELDAARLYEEAKRYNWRANPGDAILAHSLFASAVRHGHLRAKGALAEMMFAGAGVPKEQALAMATTWQVFAPCDLDPLESLTEQVHMYADELSDPVEQALTRATAKKFETALELLREATDHVTELARRRKVELQCSNPGGQPTN